MIPFSKKLLILDYAIAAILLVIFIGCVVTDGVFMMITTNSILASGADIYTSLSSPFDLTNIAIVIGTWCAQLGISSAAYYLVIKSEHKIQLPMRLINELPDDIKERLDLTEVINTVLTSSDN
jgi:hypothetical protein